MFPMINKKETGLNIRKIMDAKGLSVKDIQQYLNLASVQSIYHWLNGQSMPTIDNLYALSELFGIPIDAIVRGNRKPCVFDRFDIEIISRKSSERRFYTYYERLCRNHAA